MFRSLKHVCHRNSQWSRTIWEASSRKGGRSLIPLSCNSQVPSSPQMVAKRTVSSAPPSHPVRRPVSVLDIGSGLKEYYAPFWLRENCQCSECVHPETKQRMVDTFSVPPDVKVLRSSRKDDDIVQVTWSDGHHGVYPISWLRHHRHLQTRVINDLPLTFRPFRSWEHEKDSAFPTVSYDEIMSSDQGLLHWLENIYEWGFSFVKGVPIDPELTKILIERIAFIRETHYGGFWDFTADLTFKDTAYTTEFIGAHTDNTYFTDPARLQLFHLLSHTDGEGGGSLLVDGFKAAMVMMEENPQHLDALIQYPQPFHSSGNEVVSVQPVSQAPVLGLKSPNKQLCQIRWNNYDRAAKTDWSYEEQDIWYAAARHWNDIIKRESMEIWTQLEPGTALIFDNWRMLHGRTDFTGKRRMCGGYTTKIVTMLICKTVNNDDFLSRYRLLKFGREYVLTAIGSTSSGGKNPNNYV